MALRGLIRRLKREASKDAVLLYQRDGSLKAFPTMDVHIAMYLAWLDLAVDREQSASTKEVLDAVRNATPESRRAFEERFGSITMRVEIVEHSLPGAWVKVRTMDEDGSYLEVFHEGGSEEAERIRQEAQQR